MKVAAEGFSSHQVLVNELDIFYCRFDGHNFSYETAVLKKKKKRLTLTIWLVIIMFTLSQIPSNTQTRTNASPNNIGSCMLIHCAEQLSPILTNILTCYFPCRGSLPEHVRGAWRFVGSAASSPAPPWSKFALVPLTPPDEACPT